MKSNLNPPAYEKVQDMHNCITFLQRDCAIVVHLYPTRYNEDYCTFGEGGCYLRWSAKVTTTSPGSKDLHTFVGPRGAALGWMFRFTVGTWVLPRQIESFFQHDLLCHIHVLFIYHNLSVNTNLYPILALQNKSLL